MKRFTGMMSITLLSIIFLAGCASVTTINSNPTSAEIYVDGVKMGVTPYTHSDTDLSFSTKTIQLKAHGYKDFTGIIKRDKMNTQNAVISFICFFPGLLWSWEYPPSYTFTLVKNTADLYEMSYEFAPEHVASN